MEIKYIFWLAGIIIALIGVIYTIMASNISNNTKEIKKVAENADSRLDATEKDIVKIKAKTKIN